MATLNYEFLRYVEIARTASLPRLVIEMPHDLFAPSRNASKRRLAKLPIHVGHDRIGTPRIRSVSVVDFSHVQGAAFFEMACRNGDALVTFHRALFTKILDLDIASDCLNEADLHPMDTPLARYERMFALATCFGALAESFIPVDGEARFLEHVVAPAYEATIRRFGVPPRIVRLLPPDTEQDPLWESYPPCALAEAKIAAHGRCA